MLEVPSMKRFIKSVVLVSLPALLLVFSIMELFFRFVIPACEPPITRFDENYRMLMYDQSLAESGLYTVGKLAEQRGRWRINNHGWNSPLNYNTNKTRTRVAVIGDSYVEAIQVDSDKSYPSLLRKALRDTIDVYSFGISGASLSHYLHMFRYTLDLFDPDIIVINVVHNDFHESIHNLDPEQEHMLTLDIQGADVREVEPVAYVPSKFRRLVRKSAFARYLFLNLKVNNLFKSIRRRDRPAYDANVEMTEVTERAELIRKGAAYVLRGLRLESKGKRLILIVDAPRTDIYESRLDDSEVLFLNRMLAELCERSSLEFLDLTESMAADYAASGKRFDSKTDMHWNEYGHGFVARQVLRKLFPDSMPPPIPPEGESR
jgi:hypothetical protein